MRKFTAHLPRLVQAMKVPFAAALLVVAISGVLSIAHADSATLYYTCDNHGKAVTTSGTAAGNNAPDLKVSCDNGTTPSYDTVQSSSSTAIQIVCASGSALLTGTNNQEITCSLGGAPTVGTVPATPAAGGTTTTPPAAGTGNTGTGGKLCSSTTAGSNNCGLPQANPSPAALQTIVGNVFLGVGILAVIFLIIGAARYTLSGGDPKATKEAKETILYAIIGLVIALVAFTVVSIVGIVAGGGSL